MSVEDYSPSKRNDANMEENTYCIVLNVAEGIGFNLNNFKNDDLNDGLILKASLNGVVFEVEGNFTQPNLISINSNCIWECELNDIKRIKTDNRPVKLEYFLKHDYYKNGSTKRLGLLLLSLRGVKILNSLSNLQIKPHWYKLTYLSPKCRQNTPQVYLMLAIVKKSILDHINLENCLENNKSAIESPTKKGMLSLNVAHTLSMLQSQHGIYVKLLEDVGQIQVGSDPRTDCDIFCVTLTFHQLKNILSLLNVSQMYKEKINKKSFVFQYDFLGSISNVEIVINANDCYTINQKVSLSFRSSLKSLRMYFQRIFYIPINLYYMNDIAIAKYNFEISSFLPDDTQYFNEKGVALWTKYGSFYFDILCKKASPRTLLPTVEFMLTMELNSKNVQEKQCDIATGTNKDTRCHEMEFEMKSLIFESKETDQLQLQQSEVENDELKYFHSCAKGECETNPWSKKSLRTVAVNTDDHFEVQEREKLYSCFSQQFNDWKKQQIIYFLNELALTKQVCMQDLQQQEFLMTRRIETKFMKCDHLFAQLENIQLQLKNVAAIIIENATAADNIKKEIVSSNRAKISQLEKEIRGLTMEAKVKEIEKTELKEHIDQLEKQLAICKNSHLPIDQLKNILNDMRNQANRFTAIEYFYTEEWSNEMNKFKNKILKLIDEQKITSFNVNFGLEEIFNEDIITQKSNNINSIEVSSVNSINSCSSDNENFI